MIDESTNLLDETISDLKQFDKSPSEVLWVGSRDGEFALKWESFAAIANVYYDSGFGAQQVVSDLVVVGDGWWLERHEYDGSESWSYKTTPVKKQDAKPYNRVLAVDCGWQTLGEITDADSR